MALVLNLVDYMNNQITGDSKVPGYEGCIDVLQWRWTGSFNPDSSSDVMFLKSFDSATVPLLVNAHQYALYGNLYDVDTSVPNRVQRVELKGITIQSVAVGGSSVPPSREEVTLRYSYITFYGTYGQGQAVELQGPPPPTPAPAPG
jgi:type VI protein secretion system component Hcp